MKLYPLIAGAVVGIGWGAMKFPANDNVNLGERTGDACANIPVPENNFEINGDQQEDLNYWCEKFNCGEKQIWAAMSMVGSSAMKVENFLRLSKQIE